MGDRVDYDLVILGGGQLGFDVARRSAAFHGRVALVTQGVGFDAGPLGRLAWLNAWRSAAGEKTLALAEGMIAQQKALYYEAEGLAQLGVEVIDSVGRFVRKPHLVLDLGTGRRLRSRRYLLALPPQEFATNVGKLPVWQLDQPLPDRLIVFEDWEMALALGRLGRGVTFVTKDWPGLDFSLSQWIQVQLEALGVQVWVGEQPDLESFDACFGLVQRQPADYADLNLPAQWSREKGLQRDRLGVTTHRRIFAIEHVSEIPTLLHNAFWLANRPLPLLDQAPQAEVVQWGCGSLMSSKGIVVVRQEFSCLPIAQVQGAPEGFCQLVVRADGRVIGAQIAGDRAGELLAIVVANPRIEALESCLVSYGENWAEIFRLLATEFVLRRSLFRWRRDFLESFFAWTRQWR